MAFRRCDLLENSYLCGISNNYTSTSSLQENVVICLKIRTFVVSATTRCIYCFIIFLLWFAWKFVPLWYQQQLKITSKTNIPGCDLLENSYLCGISNNTIIITNNINELWFAWKFVPLWYQQQLLSMRTCLSIVVICLKIRTFVVSATTLGYYLLLIVLLWFAWKFVPLWYQQQHG